MSSAFFATGWARLRDGVTIEQAQRETSALAAWIPARRAARVDPVVALRAD